MSDVIAPPAVVRIPVQDNDGAREQTFPVHRVYCVGRNFADHAREMGADVAVAKADRGQPVFFLKPTDAIVTDGVVPYPPATQDLHHEIEMVVALGADAPVGVLPVASAMSLVFGVGVGLDLTRRDLQAAAKARGMPWDTGKSFDFAAPVSAIVSIAAAGDLDTLSLTLSVNGVQRQHGSLGDLVWSVPEILHELSKLYALRAGDLVFMGTPAGVGPLHPGDHFVASLGDIVELRGRIAPALSTL